ncbi:hypothetical protein [Planosporangium flavigriseum]|uniref:hypothetical protein n=1 Tax=Planosporangium flavigriseum TaxID=373681 RepID=UPI00194F3370|nr:hypothetical protein [Planosporangium flavigriseum]
MTGSVVIFDPAPRLTVTIEMRADEPDLTASLARDESIHDAIRTGAAAGAVNVTRRGLGSGQRDAIMALRERVRLQPLRASGASTGTWEGSHVQTSPEQLAERIRPT